MNVIEKMEKEAMRSDLPDFRVGDTVRVYFRIIEGEKSRVQPFQGAVIRKKKGLSRATFTVRKIS